MSLALELKNIKKSFAQGTERLTILDGLSLEVRSGEVIAIVGQSGSGKSTLLSLIAGFETPDAGEIAWSGQSTAGFDEKAWAHFRREHLGFVFQNYQLIPYLTALENVALPLELLRRPPAPARDLLKSLGLEARAAHLPNQLSGGERQRVSIARALVHGPNLVLADEPTGSLDRETGAKVLDVFFDALREFKQSAILVTHSDEVAARCDRRLELKAGRLCSI